MRLSTLSLPTLSHVETPALRMQKIAFIYVYHWLDQANPRSHESLELYNLAMEFSFGFLGPVRIAVVQIPNRTERRRAFTSPM